MTRPKVELRMAGAGDAAAIASVLEESFVEFRSQYTEEGFRATTPAEAVIRARLAEGPTWVALCDGVISGTVSAVVEGERLHIRSMAVLPRARGGGIARALLEEIESFATEHGRGRLYLSTTAFLHSAIRLYERSGFRRTDEGPHELFGTPLFTMEKRVGAGG